jgi:hypothetical protein
MPVFCILLLSKALKVGFRDPHLNLSVQNSCPARMPCLNPILILKPKLILSLPPMAGALPSAGGFKAPLRHRQGLKIGSSRTCSTLPPGSAIGVDPAAATAAGQNQRLIKRESRESKASLEPSGKFPFRAMDQQQQYGGEPLRTWSVACLVLFRCRWKVAVLAGAGGSGRQKRFDDELPSVDDLEVAAAAAVAAGIPEESCSSDSESETEESSTASSDSASELEESSTVLSDGVLSDQEERKDGGGIGAREEQLGLSHITVQLVVEGKSDVMLHLATIHGLFS